MPDPVSTLPQDPLVNHAGVDLSLIRYALRQTPTERLRALQAFIDTMRTVRRPSSNDFDANAPRDR